MSEPSTTMPSVIPEQQQQVTCPSCSMAVPYASFCSNCGASLPPIGPPVIAAPPAHRRSRRLILGIILAIILATSVAGVFGYTMYQNNQQSILQAAKNSELSAVNQAINQLSTTCTSPRFDTSTLVRTNPPSGYMTLYLKVGVYNPSQYPMDVTWSITINYPSITVTISTTHSFHLDAKSTSYPEFPFQISATQVAAFGAFAGTSTGIPQFTVTLDGAYSVTGTYSTYHINQHQTVDSSTSSTGTGSTFAGAGAGTSTTACP